MSVVGRIVSAHSEAHHWENTTNLDDSLKRKCNADHHRCKRLRRFYNENKPERCGGCNRTWVVVVASSKGNYELRDPGQNERSSSYAMCHVTVVENGTLTDGLLFACKQCNRGMQTLQCDAWFYPCEIHGTPPASLDKYRK